MTGLFKEVWGDSPIEIIPYAEKFQRAIGFSKHDMSLGNQYNHPVIVSGEQGVTYAGPDSGVFTFNAAVAATSKNANLKGYQMVATGELSWEAAAKASAGKEAFVQATSYLIKNMQKTIRKRLELELLYGGSDYNIGKINTSTNQSATQTRLNFAAAEWGVRIWAGLENAVLNFYQDDEIVSSAANAVFTVARIDLDNMYVYVNGTSTGITALDAQIAGSGQTVPYFNGQFGNQMIGIEKIISQSGLLFGIDNNSYGMWKGVSHDCNNAALTMTNVFNGAAKVQGRGLDGPTDLYVSSKTYANLNSELKSDRMYDSSYSYKTGTNGFEGIELYSTNGGITIKTHDMIKQGEAFMFPSNVFKRIGSMDISFNTPGRSDEIFRPLTDKAGYQFAAYTNQALFCEMPCYCLKFINIVNS